MPPLWQKGYSTPTLTEHTQSIAQMEGFSGTNLWEPIKVSPLIHQLSSTVPTSYQIRTGMGSARSMRLTQAMGQSTGIALVSTRFHHWQWHKQISIFKM